MAIAVVSYIPALHKGYVDFFKKYKQADLFVLGGEYTLEVPRMERDIRALEPKLIKAMVATTDIMNNVQVLDEKRLSEIFQYEKIIMPDEDVNRHFAEEHLDETKVEFVSVFLRWDKQISTTEFEVPAHRVVTSNARDKELMGRAFAEAGKSPDWWRQVGAIVTRDGEPLLVGHNKPFPSEDYTLNVFGDPRSNFDAGVGFEISKAIHAEAGAIAEAAKRGVSLEGTSIYVTTFPCPVCAKSVAAAGIKKVYYSKGYSLLDAEDVLKSHNVEIVLVQD
jgi:dCMP deaminase